MKDIPIFGVVDFEACMKKKTRLESAVQHACLACANNRDETMCAHATRDVHVQKPMTYSMVFVDVYGEVIYQDTDSDEDSVMDKFFESLFLIQKHVFRKLQRCKYKQGCQISQRPSGQCCHFSWPVFAFWPRWGIKCVLLHFY